MKHKNTLLILLVILLCAVVFFLSKSDESLNRQHLTNFAISDTSKVTKIIISDKVPSKAVLERDGNSKWLVNNQYRVSKSKIFYLLQTLNRMKIAHPVPINMRDNVIGNLQTYGIKVEVYSENGEEKIFYVGGENNELTATFMLLRGALDPYAVHIPGFNGYLSTRFFTQEYLWRDKLIMSYDNREIMQVDLQYHSKNQSDDSFHLSVSDSIIKLSNWANYEFDADTVAIETYRAAFRNLFAISFVSGTLNTDSLMTRTPLISLNVKTNTNKQTEILFYSKKAAPGTQVNGDVTMRDPESIYAFVNKSDWYVIQRQKFNQVFTTLDKLRMK